MDFFLLLKFPLVYNSLGLWEMNSLSTASKPKDVNCKLQEQKSIFYFLKEFPLFFYYSVSSKIYLKEETEEIKEGNSMKKTYFTWPKFL